MGMLRRLMQLPVQWIIMIPEAIWLTGLYRYLILHRPFSQLSPKIGTLGQETPTEGNCPDTVYGVRKIVTAVSKRMPWTCNCMVQALTAKKMLSRRGIPTTMYMGVALDANGNMEAHAWLRCCSEYVTGQAGMERFTVTTVYGP